MTFQSAMTEKDFVGACWLATRKRSRSGLLALAIFPLLAVLLLGMGAYAVSLGQSWSSQLFGNVWALLLGIFPLVFYPYTFRKAFRKGALFAQQPTYHLDQEGMQIVSRTYDSKMKWGMFSKFTENDRVFVVFQQGNKLYLPVPKRDLTEDQLSEIQGILERHLKRV